MWRYAPRLDSNRLKRSRGEADLCSSRAAVVVLASACAHARTRAHGASPRLVHSS